MKTHGFTIGIERHKSLFFLSMKATGVLTHEDYKHFTPIIDGALGSVVQPIVYGLLDVTEMEGWELRAAWDDFKIGIKHRSEFKKIALYGNKSWQEKLSIFAGWFISGDVKFFENKGKALAWLSLDS